MKIIPFNLINFSSSLKQLTLSSSLNLGPSNPTRHHVFTHRSIASAAGCDGSQGGTAGSWRPSFKTLDELHGCHRDNYNWGFQIYRTAYSPACPDSEFERALAILHEYMRFECFVEVDDDHEHYTGDANEPEQLIWAHLKNNVIQNPSKLNGASMSRIRQLAKDWIEERGAEMSESPRYRFFIIFDDEVVQNLLQFPTPIKDYPDEWQSYSVKVVDVEHEDQGDQVSKPPGRAQYEGWFWTAAWKLQTLAFMDYIRDGSEIYCFDEQKRPLHWLTGMEMSWT